VRVYQEFSEEGLIYTDSTNGKFLSINKQFIEERKSEYLRTQIKLFIENIKVLKEIMRVM